MSGPVVARRVEGDIRSGSLPGVKRGGAVVLSAVAVLLVAAVAVAPARSKRLGPAMPGRRLPPRVLPCSPTARPSRLSRRPWVDGCG